MSQIFKTVLQLLICFFSCVGITYLTYDLHAFITRKKKITCVTAVITIPEKTLYPIKELVNFSDFYNKTYASRYIDKILIINNSGKVIENPDELKKILRLSAKIEILQSKNIEKENKYV